MSKEEGAEGHEESLERMGFNKDKPQQFGHSEFDIYARSKDSHINRTKSRLPLPAGITYKKGIAVGKVVSVSTGGSVHMCGSKRLLDQGIRSWNK